MSKRPFFVLPGGICVPLEGDWRIEALRGDWYVLGHHTVVPCESEQDALLMLAEFQAQTDIDLLAEEAIRSLDAIPPTWESDGLEESSPA